MIYDHGTAESKVHQLTSILNEFLSSGYKVLLDDDLVMVTSHDGVERFGITSWEGKFHHVDGTPAEEKVYWRP